MKFASITLFPLFFLFATPALTAQESSHEWFPKNSLFPMLEYDLLEVQPYAGFFFLHSDKVENNAAYIPVNLGLRKSFIQWTMCSAQFDLALGASSYTQFEIMRYDQNTLRGGLLNTDFKASGYLNISKNKNKFRIQLFHISSHLGDDYILRNQQYKPNDKSVNYEQIDFIYLFDLKQTDFYVGLGYIVTPNTFRERFMAELGLQANIEMKDGLDLTYGFDIKIYEENGFYPDIHAGIGVTLNQRSQPQLSFLLDTYFGSLPYSTLDLGQVFWIGPSCRIYL